MRLDVAPPHVPHPAMVMPADQDRRRARPGPHSGPVPAIPATRRPGTLATGTHDNARSGSCPLPLRRWARCQRRGPEAMCRPETPASRKGAARPGAAAGAGTSARGRADRRDRPSVSRSAHEAWSRSCPSPPDACVAQAGDLPAPTDQPRLLRGQRVASCSTGLGVTGSTTPPESVRAGPGGPAAHPGRLAGSRARWEATPRGVTMPEWQQLFPCPFHCSKASFAERCIPGGAVVDAPRRTARVRGIRITDVLLVVLTAQTAAPGLLAPTSQCCNNRLNPRLRQPPEHTARREVPSSRA